MSAQSAFQKGGERGEMETDRKMELKRGVGGKKKPEIVSM